MDASKQQGSIALTKQDIDGQDYIRIEYADNQTIALLLSQDNGIKTTSIYLHVTSTHKSSIPNSLDTLDDS